MTTISSYSTLQQAISDWMRRSDLTSYTDYFVQSAEDDIYNDIFTLNEGRGTQALETVLAASIANGVMALPSGYLGLRWAGIVSGSDTWALQRRSAEFIMQAYPAQTPEGPPTFVARSGSNFIFGPYPDQDYSVTGIYWQRSAALSSTNPTTWMTSTIPMTLFTACMKAVYAFLKDAQKAADWDVLYQARLNSYLTADRAEEYSGSELSMTPL